MQPPGKSPKLRIPKVDPDLVRLEGVKRVMSLSGLRAGAGTGNTIAPTKRPDRLGTDAITYFGAPRVAMRRPGKGGFNAATVYGGSANLTMRRPGKGGFNAATVYGGVANLTMRRPGGGGWNAETVYGGVGNLTMRRPGAEVSQNPAGSTVQSTGNLRTLRVIHPRTMEPVRITYNVQHATYLDLATGRWLPAPGWMRGQLYHLI